MTRPSTFGAVGAALAFLGVAGGAFGAHALEGRMAPDLLEIFGTAVEYQMYHALALLLLSVLPREFSGPGPLWAGRLFVAGTIVFSGSLYILAFTGVRWLGAITPIGGVCFLGGWTALGWGLITAARRDAGRVPGQTNI